MFSAPNEPAQAVRVLLQITQRHKTLDQALPPEARPRLREIVYGVLRHYYSLNQEIDRFLTQALRAKDHDLKLLLKVGLYQLRHMRVANYAAVDQTVAAAKILGKPWAKGLINGVLRSLERAPEPVISLDHPEWMATKLMIQYPDTATDLMAANNQRAPMTLRVNRKQVAVDTYKARLNEAGIEFSTGYLREMLILAQPCPVTELPGFSQGQVAVQDGGAQLAVSLSLAATARSRSTGGDHPRTPGDRLRILDACAAPGGKLFHLIECEPDAEVVGLELSGPRLETLRSMARQLNHHSVSLLQGDATDLQWWDRRSFDHLLLDAPCSGSGTLRRHPDIKVLKTPADLHNHQHLQLSLMENLWQCLRPGGSLLYCTCSIFTEENDHVVQRFVTTHHDARSQPIQLPTGSPRRYGWQLLPIDPITDGFYYAVLEKAR
ncbi:MAG: 16S rRNA (cytosine(967)-C(5))-methyltransferase RsmB [Proteobacteria bacterium]|nr:16S rRNA (cytosine(967)-C(5))-methyltransferase RsmB [Pseudomonadota bacterium]